MDENIEPVEIPEIKVEVKAESKTKTSSTQPKRKPKPKIDYDEPAKRIKYTGDFQNDIGDGKKLFNKKDSVEKMEKSTIEFVGNTSRRVFLTAEKEEQAYLDELVAKKYYPSKAVSSKSEEDLVCEQLNLV